METKHTPGPWAGQKTAGHEIHSQSAVYDEVTGESIAIVYDGEANARLIAAAPDLLAALTTLVAWMDDSGLSHTQPGGKGVLRYEGTEYNIVTNARAAIAKAEGE
ncbi:MAG: hypothetical protein GY832_31690 [Chloroflexi bacterium]|nr:hypothetical protein [Chloroflexota bacterium]